MRCHEVEYEIFDGQALFLATLQGKGTVGLKSLPFSNLHSRVIQVSAVSGQGDLFGNR